MMRWFASFALALVGGCGYHLAGSSTGPLPEDVHSVAIVAVGDEAGEAVWELRRQLELRTPSIVWVGNGEEAQAELRVGPLLFHYQPVAYDATGVATTFRATLSGDLSVWRDGARTWDTGSIRIQEDVYAVGSPVSIEALKARVIESLYRRWNDEAVSRFVSGF